MLKVLTLPEIKDGVTTCDVVTLLLHYSGGLVHECAYIIYLDKLTLVIEVAFVYIIKTLQKLEHIINFSVYEMFIFVIFPYFT